MPVRPEGGNHQKYGHAGKKKHTGVEVFLFIFEKAVKHCRGNIGKPEKIRDYMKGGLITFFSSHANQTQ